MMRDSGTVDFRVPIANGELVKWQVVPPSSFAYRVHARTHIMCVYIQGVPGGMCQTSGNCSLPDSTQTCTPDTHTNKGHTTTYQQRQMTKRAAEAW
jgi:hypothetical protein